MQLIRTTMALALLVAAPMAAELAAELGLNVAGLSAIAAERGEKPQKTRRVPSMSEQTFKKLSAAQELMDLKDLAGAEAVLQGMLDRSRRYNGNEIGQIHNMLGFVYFSMEDYKRAIREYAIVVAQGEDIPQGLEITTLYTLAQLSFVDEQYTEALRYMEIWLSKASNPGPDPHIFMGQVYYQMTDYPSAIQQIEKGINVAQTRGTSVKENWWGLLNYLYYEEENWPRVLDILEIMVEDFPKRVYWIRLAGIQGQEGMEKEQVYTMEAAYTAGFLELERDLTNFAGLLMQEEVPIRAAKVMRKGIDDEIIERTDKNLRTLGQAYQLAQEVDLAIPAFEDAAKLSDDGIIYERLAHLYLEADKYQKCVVASKNALDKGGLRKKQSVYVVQGMCQYNRDNLRIARTSFISCRNESRRVKDEYNQRICQQWITFIDREAARRRELERSI